MDSKKMMQQLRTKIVFTIDQLSDIARRSVTTARRRLKEWGTFTSINKNGRYYVLKEIPQFDQNGLWRYNSIVFSKHGNLKNTVIKLISESETGLKASEISELVGLPTHSSFISSFYNSCSEQIRREKHQGLYVYFSAESEIYNMQKKNLILKTQMPSNDEAITILVQFISHPGISIEELADKVAKKGIKIETTVINNFLQHHQILEKKTAMMR